MRSLVQIQNGPAGGIAQLVERCLCTADVSGSSPLISTNMKFQKFQKNNLTSFCLIQEIKGLWGIPWHSEAMKDVATCDNLRGAGSKL